MCVILQLCNFLGKRHKVNDLIKYLYSIDKKQRFSTNWSLAYIVYLLAFSE
jgi:hypothetical protein